jgi:hypothetical protein
LEWVTGGEGCKEERKREREDVRSLKVLEKGKSIQICSLPTTDLATGPKSRFGELKPARYLKFDLAFGNLVKKGFLTPCMYMALRKPQSRQIIILLNQTPKILNPSQ